MGDDMYRRANLGSERCTFKKQKIFEKGVHTRVA
jgi:hypothetical protein